MSTRRAVVSYPVEATREEKIGYLRRGLYEIGAELGALGYSLHSLEDDLDETLDAAIDAKWEWEDE